MEREKEIKSEMANYKKVLAQPGLCMATQTWIGVAMKDLRAELKSIKIEKKLLEDRKNQ